MTQVDDRDSKWITSGVLHTMRIIMALGGLAAHLVQAQAYRPFPEGNAGWVERSGGLDPGGIDCQSDFIVVDCIWPILFDPDTVIDGTTYHHLIRHGFCDWECNPPDFGPLPPWCPGCSGSYLIPWQTFLFFRQDIPSKQVFIYDPSTGQEELLYDFNMGVGTYPPTYNNNVYPDLNVVSIDSVLLGDGYHKRFNIAQALGGEGWVIEGVGSSWGLTAPMEIFFEHYTAMECFSRDDSLIYPNPIDFPDYECALTLNIPDQQIAATTELIIQPNPARDHIRLRGEARMARYWITASTGEVVMTDRTLGDDEIEVAGLAPGVYAIHVQDRQGEFSGRARFIKF